ncbi:MAG TPA: sulfatase, partial [Actinomycetota bacterium]|nr:sulfatase [Actinomycetota bacterium]
FNLGPFGGWPAFQASESDTIATALDAAGYRTALIGKYLNGYGGAGLYVPPGWDRWFAFAGGGAYYNYTIFDDAAGPGPVSYGSRPKDYSTDVVRRKAVGFIRSAPTDAPFFLMVTPFAPHQPVVPAPRHVGAFAGAPVPLRPSVNEVNVTDKPAYVRARPMVDPEKVRRLTRRRWEMLLAVDEMVSRIVAVLEETGRGSNTLVIFTSDNGYLLNEHRWQGKLVPYEESIRVPMIVRLPGEIPAGTVSDALVSNVDLAPTLADFAGAPLAADGVSLRQLLIDEVSFVRSSVVLEHIVGGTTVPTYCGVRTRSFTFVHYATGEEELYDLTQDPSQLINIALTRPNKATELRDLTRTLCDPVPPGFSW